MAELDRLLGFMSSWDRYAALKKYQALFAAASDEEALIEELGTPTKLAIDLAAAYVPTPSPSALANALIQCPVALEDMLRAPGAPAATLDEPEPEEADDGAPKPETWVFESAGEPESIEAAPEAEPEPELQWGDTAAAPASRVRGGVLAAYLIPAIVIGLPVAAVLVCVGVPFLCGGGALIYGAVHEVLKVLGSLTLVSDMLLTGGAALLLCAVGLLLAWFGLWLSIQLCWVWVNALCGLGRRLCVREEAA